MANGISKLDEEIFQMSSIAQLSIENVRCFADEQTVALPRVTLLVGENNTGKTTFLACCAAIAQLACNEEVLYNPFNKNNFDLGTFNTIARNKSDSFSLGGMVDGVDFWFQFSSARRTADLWEKKARIRPANSDEIKIEREASKSNWEISSSSFSFSLDRNSVSYNQISQWLGKAIRYQYLPYGGYEYFKTRAGVSKEEIEEFSKLDIYLRKLSSILPKNKPAIHSVSPEIESRARNYKNLPLWVSSPEEFESQREELKQKGQKIKLYSDIRMTSHIDGTISIEVAVGGEWYNLTDVGFGVHSILPVLQSIPNDRGMTVLMQQPETHLHPKAEWGLANIIARSKSRFLIETHSDFITRRMRVCVREGKIKPEDIVLLWFEQNDGISRIHSLQIDKEGNVINAPAGFREFFIKETRTSLGFE